MKWWESYSWLSICPNHLKRVSLKDYLEEVCDLWTEKNYVSLWIDLRWRYLVSSLFIVGENSGKAAKHVAKHIPGALAEMNQQVNRSTNEISNAHRLMVERGQKLGQLEDSAERMANEAQAFSSGAHELMLKYKEKKWYQLWSVQTRTLVIVQYVAPYLKSFRAGAPFWRSQTC